MAERDGDTMGRNGGSSLAALLMTVPVGAILWFELLHLAFGFTGSAASPLGAGFAAVGAFGLVFAWLAVRGGSPAAVVERGCRFGILLAALLPVVAIAALWLWRTTGGRRDVRTGGLMLHDAPLISFVVSLLLIVAFVVGHRLARRRLARPPAD
jgi:predicted Kef-type K+ transport protein